MQTQYVSHIYVHIETLKFLVLQRIICVHVDSPNSTHTCIYMYTRTGNVQHTQTPSNNLSKQRRGSINVVINFFYRYEDRLSKADDRYFDRLIRSVRLRVFSRPT